MKSCVCQKFDNIETEKCQQDITEVMVVALACLFDGVQAQ